MEVTASGGFILKDHGDASEAALRGRPRPANEVSPAGLEGAEGGGPCLGHPAGCPGQAAARATVTHSLAQPDASCCRSASSRQGWPASAWPDSAAAMASGPPSSPGSRDPGRRPGPGAPRRRRPRRRRGGRAPARSSSALAWRPRRPAIGDRGRPHLRLDSSVELAELVLQEPGYAAAWASRGRSPASSISAPAWRACASPPMASPVVDPSTAWSAGPLSDSAFRFVTRSYGEDL